MLFEKVCSCECMFVVCEECEDLQGCVKYRLLPRTYSNQWVLNLWYTYVYVFPQTVLVHLGSIDEYVYYFFLKVPHSLSNSLDSVYSTKINSVLVFICSMLRGRLQREIRSVHISLMYTHLIWCCIVDNWLFPIHTFTNHWSTKGALSNLMATAHATYYK